MPEIENGQTPVNTPRTSAAPDTNVTQPRSPDVLRDLLVKRNRVGAETPLGWNLSNLIEQMRNHERETDPTARANLERFMGWSVKAIQGLAA